MIDIQDRMVAALAEAKAAPPEAVSVLVDVTPLANGPESYRYSIALQAGPALAARTYPDRAFGRVLHIEAAGPLAYEVAVEVLPVQAPTAVAQLRAEDRPR